VNARINGVTVPDGWTIPFFYYDQFLRENKLQPFIRTMLADERFRRDGAFRRERLAQIRSLIQRGAISPELRRAVFARYEKGSSAGGVFVRSSSNTEDLPNFNGAGLYDTVPNVRGERELIEAIKMVWASLWNFEAYESRERAGVDHARAMMAVIVQHGINAEAAGVMITVDPFNYDNREAIYINAKRGLGIRVVEGKRIAEQILYNPRSRQTDVLTRSAEDSLLEFDERGGVREVPIKGMRIVLTDDVIRRLAYAAQELKKHFGSEQDIEWALMGNEIYIVQSRPYITNGVQQLATSN
jgi:phosphoenolpyruvate synthase/pyruvate phosphate dikinase